MIVKFRADSEWMCDYVLFVYMECTCVHGVYVCTWRRYTQSKLYIILHLQVNCSNRHAVEQGESVTISLIVLLAVSYKIKSRSTFASLGERLDSTPRLDSLPRLDSSTRARAPPMRLILTDVHVHMYVYR